MAAQAAQMTPRRHRFWGIIAAGGRGTRTGLDVPKQYVTLNGLTILERSIRALGSHPDIAGLVVGISVDDQHFATLALAGHKLLGSATGGATRAITVANALDALADHAAPDDWVLVHDAARPFLTHADIDALITAANQGAPGAVLGWPVVDSLARSSETATVTRSVDRTGLWRTATPQMFRYRALGDALARVGDGLDDSPTDELAAILATGGDARMIPCSEDNFKITTEHDIQKAKAMLGKQAGIRVGTGYDVHAFAENRRLILGGVEISHSHGLAGHSDADVLLHAVCDALLGAASLGDIGKHFPDTDARWMGADSRTLLRTVRTRISEQGFVVNNLDCVVIAEAPRLAPHVDAMRENIAADLAVSAGQVSVKATTTESLGFTGRREGIAAQAIVSLST